MKLVVTNSLHLQCKTIKGAVESVKAKICGLQKWITGNWNCNSIGISKCYKGYAQVTQLQTSVHANILPDAQSSVNNNISRKQQHITQTPLFLKLSCQAPNNNQKKLFNKNKLVTTAWLTVAQWKNIQYILLL